MITRAVADPLDVFSLVAERMGIPAESDQRAFSSCRAAVESRLRRSLRESDDLRLEQIYDNVLRSLPALHHVTVAEAVAAEIEVELDVTRPWQPGIRLLTEWRSRARFVGFLSDMYLPATAIQRMIDRVGAWQPGDRIFVSGDERATKASGRLYAQVMSQLSIAPERLTHLGDNSHSDITVPMRLGIRTITVPRPAHRPRTRKVLGQGSRQSRLAGVLASAAGDIPVGLDPHQRVVWQVGVNVLAPAALCFANSILHGARDDRRRNLWFLARDGQIVHSAAMIANRKGIFPGGLHYVMASRQALHLPATRELDSEARRWLLANPDIATPTDVADRAGLTATGRQQWLEAVQPFCGHAQPISVAMNEVWRILTTEPHRTRLLELAAERRIAALAYFRRFSDFHDLGIVDVGWGANLQCSLQHILETPGITGYYLGLFSRNAQVPASAVRPTLFDFAHGDHEPWLAGRSVLECIFSGTHAGVRAYQVTADDHGEPVLENEASWFPQRRWGVELLHQAAVRAMEQLAAERLMPSAKDAISILLGFIHRPDHDEALSVGRWPVQDLQNRSSSSPLADPPSWRGVVSVLVSGRHLPRTLWQAGERELMGVRRHLAYRVIRRLSSRLYL